MRPTQIIQGEIKLIFKEQPIQRAMYKGKFHRNQLIEHWRQMYQELFIRFQIQIAPKNETLLPTNY